MYLTADFLSSAAGKTNPYGAGSKEAHTHLFQYGSKNGDGCLFVLAKYPAIHNISWRVKTGSEYPAKESAVACEICLAPHAEMIPALQ